MIKATFDNTEVTIEIVETATVDALVEMCALSEELIARVSKSIEDHVPEDKTKQEVMGNIVFQMLKHLAERGIIDEREED